MGKIFASWISCEVAWCASARGYFRRSDKTRGAGEGYQPCGDLEGCEDGILASGCEKCEHGRVDGVGGGADADEHGAQSASEKIKWDFSMKYRKLSTN